LRPSGVTSWGFIAVYPMFRLAGKVFFTGNIRFFKRISFSFRNFSHTFVMISKEKSRKDKRFRSEIWLAKRVK